ncbi:MAG: hypothetical protein Q8L29_03620 [archaeon]|nr:hypothetical protein [archaeon]
MRIKIPENFMGKPVKGSIERGLANAPAPSTPEPEKPAPVIKPRTSVPATDPQNYIILPGATHGKYNYPDTLVSMERRHFNKDWISAHAALYSDDEYMLTIRQFADFLALLKTGKAFDGAGSQVDPQRIEGILDEILTVRNPWRSEWLDAKFENKGGILGLGSKLHINYDHRFLSGVNSGLSHQYSEEVDCLMTDKQIDISDWLNNANEHGLPTKNTSGGQIYYYYPRNGRVAWFLAYSGWAYLDCDRDPTYSDTSLGVRPAREKI